MLSEKNERAYGQIIHDLKLNRKYPEDDSLNDPITVEGKIGLEILRELQFLNNVIIAIIENTDDPPVCK